MGRATGRGTHCACHFPVVDGAGEVLSIVFLLVVVLTLIQGPTLPKVDRRLSVARTGALREIQVEPAPLDVLDSDLLTITVPTGSLLQGVVF